MCVCVCVSERKTAGAKWSERVVASHIMMCVRDIGGAVLAVERTGSRQTKIEPAHNRVPNSLMVWPTHGRRCRVLLYIP